MKKIKITLSLTFIITAIVIGCSKKGQQGNDPGSEIPPANSCEGVNAGFTADILPLVQSQCATGSGCHGNGSTNGPGALTNFNQVMSAALNIRSAVVSGRMPLGGSLSKNQINQVRCWVDNGSLNN